MNVPVVYLGGDAEFERALGEHSRVLTPSPHGVADFIRVEVGVPVHLIAEGKASATGCLVAVLEPAMVRSLVLLRPTFEDDSVEQLSEVRVPTLVLCGASDEPNPGRLAGERVPDSHRVLVYGTADLCQRFAQLAMEFFERGDRFVVADSAAGGGR